MNRGDAIIYYIRNNIFKFCQSGFRCNGVTLIGNKYAVWGS